MKKIETILLLLIMVVTMCASCAKEDVISEETDSSTSIVSEEADSTTKNDKSQEQVTHYPLEEKSLEEQAEEAIEELNAQRESGNIPKVRHDTSILPVGGDEEKLIDLGYKDEISAVAGKVYAYINEDGSIDPYVQKEFLSDGTVNQTYEDYLPGIENTHYTVIGNKIYIASHQAPVVTDYEIIDEDTIKIYEDADGNVHVLKRISEWQDNYPNPYSEP